MESSWIFTSILGLILIYLVYYVFTMNSNYWKKLGIPYVKSPPIAGVMVDFLLRKKGFGEIFTNLYFKTEGHKFIGFFQLMSPNLMIRDPELINQVLIKDFTHFEDRGPPMKGVDDLFSLNISNLVGDEWRNVRHKITPTFTSGKLKMMVAPIKECSDELVRYLDTKEGQAFDTREIMLKLILNIIGKIAFGIKVDTFNEKDEQSKDFYDKSSKFFQPSIFLFLKFMIAMNAPAVRRFFKLRMMDNDVEVFFRKLSHDVIEYRESTDAKRNDFLQLMLDLRKKNSDSLNHESSGPDGESVYAEDKELLDQLKNTPAGSKEVSGEEIFNENFISCQTFLFISGGSETTASVLNFVLYELAVNQDEQKKVQDEISSVLSSQEFSYQAVRKMTYLEQFINESLRLHPIAPALQRLCTEDYKIPGTDITIPKGMFVTIPAAGLQTDPQYFPDPQKFNPDRFEDMDAIPKGVFFPFGGGPRICIAMRLAMLEMKIVVATLLSNYNIVMSEKTKLPIKLMKNSFVLRVEGGVWVKFQKRKV